MMAMGFTTQEQFDESLRRMKATEGGMKEKEPQTVLLEWMREPDHVDFVDAKWLSDWANRRPLQAHMVIQEQAFRYRDHFAHAQEWQDISTAPKDGTPILIWEPGPHRFGNREQDREYGPDGNFTGVIREYDDKRWAIGYWRPWGGWGNRNSHDVNPTHWQPLPTGPLIADERANQELP